MLFHPFEDIFEKKQTQNSFFFFYNLELALPTAYFKVDKIENLIIPSLSIFLKTILQKCMS